MKCPVCDQTVKPTDTECECGELLTQWRVIADGSDALRQRGLTQAAQHDYWGACLSFLESALTHPWDGAGLIDAAKALVHVEPPRFAEALRLLEHAKAQSGLGARADAAAQAVRAMAEAAGKGPADSPGPVPKADSAPAVDQSSRGRRPVMGLGPIRRSTGFMAQLLGGGQLDQLWSLALTLEQEWADDWQVLDSWLCAAAKHGEHPSAFHYMRGLGFWQKSDWPEVKKAFEHCLQHKPPVLNPGPYYICLGMGDVPHARAALNRLRKNYSYSKEEIDWCLDALNDWFKSLNEGAMLKLLQQVRTEEG